MSISDSLQWIQNILPDVPSMVDSSKESVTFIYKSCFVSSFLIINLKEPKGDQEGGITMKSDNYSVLTIMKDQISQ